MPGASRFGFKVQGLVPVSAVVLLALGFILGLRVCWGLGLALTPRDVYPGAKHERLG